MNNELNINSLSLDKEPVLTFENTVDIISIGLAVIFFIILLVAIFNKSTSGFWSKIKKYSLWLLGLLNIILLFILFSKTQLFSQTVYGPMEGDWGMIGQTNLKEKIIDTFMILPRLVGNIFVLPIIFIVGITRLTKKKNKQFNNTDKT